MKFQRKVRKKSIKLRKKIKKYITNKNKKIDVRVKSLKPYKKCVYTRGYRFGHITKASKSVRSVVLKMESEGQ